MLNASPSASLSFASTASETVPPGAAARRSWTGTGAARAGAGAAGGGGDAGVDRPGRVGRGGDDDVDARAAGAPFAVLHGVAERVRSVEVRVRRVRDRAAARRPPAV